MWLATNLVWEVSMLSSDSMLGKCVALMESHVLTFIVSHARPLVAQYAAESFTLFYFIEIPLVLLRRLCNMFVTGLNHLR